MRQSSVVVIEIIRATLNWKGFRTENYMLTIIIWRTAGGSFCNNSSTDLQEKLWAFLQSERWSRSCFYLQCNSLYKTTKLVTWDWEVSISRTLLSSRSKPRSRKDCFPKVVAAMHLIGRNLTAKEFEKYSI